MHIPRARITAPVLHALLFALTSILLAMSTSPILNGPAKIPFGIVFVADLPFSAFAFSVMFFSEEYGWFAFAIWGVLGTAWWYFLGMSFEALDYQGDY
jgi:hypothetical protein